MADESSETSTSDGAAVFEERVPVTVVGPVERVLGVDVSDVTVRRGADVTTLTHRLGARGFTEDGVVYVPDDVGALDSSVAAPLLAHELTHVAQQRAHGAALPDRDTQLGRQLEEDAVRVENWMAGGAVAAPPTLVHTSRPGAQQAPKVSHNAVADALAGLLSSSAMTDMPRLDARHLVDEFERTSGLTALTEDAGRLPELSVDALLESALRKDDTDGDESGDTADGLTDDEAAAIAAAVAELFADEPPRRWFDLDDVTDFEELSGRIYHELITRLRFDMVVDRERSGTLLDFG